MNERSIAQVTEANTLAVTPASARVLQRQCACGQHTNGGECESCREEQEGTLQRTAVNAAPGAAAPPLVHQVLRFPGRPLDTATRGFFESRFGHDFSTLRVHSTQTGPQHSRLAMGRAGDQYEQEAERVAQTASHTQPSQALQPGYDFSRVRIHADSRAADSAGAVGARAYTVGHDIVFGTGQYAPGTAPGRQLLAHELTHVVQQQSADRAVVQRAETDTSRGCSHLDDSVGDVNTEVNTALASARKTAGGKTEAIIDGVFDELGDWSSSPGRTLVELWAQNLGSKKVEQPTQSATKYAGVTYGLWAQPVFPILNPTMRVKNICIGSDKFGHFFQEGFNYYDIAHRQKKGTAEAEKMGVEEEAHGFGLETTGVFSNADREANRQGLRFYEELAAKPSMKFDIGRYINAKWNEETNPSFYEAKSVAPIVWRNLLNGDWDGTRPAPGGAGPTHLSITLSVGSDNVSLTGSYTYTQRKAVVNGTISNGKITHITNDIGAVTGIKIDFDWQEGTDSGKGQWLSKNESTLGGTYGKGSSNSKAGTWNLTKRHLAAAPPSSAPAAKPTTPPLTAPGPK